MAWIQAEWFGLLVNASPEVDNLAFEAFEILLPTAGARVGRSERRGFVRRGVPRRSALVKVEVEIRKWEAVQGTCGIDVTPDFFGCGHRGISPPMLTAMSRAKWEIRRCSREGADLRQALPESSASWAVGMDLDKNMWAHWAHCRSRPTSTVADVGTSAEIALPLASPSGERQIPSLEGRESRRA